MSKLDHPSYGAHSLEPHTKEKPIILYTSACRLLQQCSLSINVDLAFNDAEYIWFDDNNQIVAGAYKSDSVLDIWFDQYTLHNVSPSEILYMLNQHKSFTIHRNDNQNYDDQTN